MLSTLLTLPTVATDPLDPGSLLRTAFIVAILVVEFYFQRRLIQTMATKEELQSAVDQVTTAVANEIQRVTATIEALKNAPGAVDDGVSPADLDGPVQSLKSLAQALDTVDVTPSGTVSSEIPGSTDAGTSSGTDTTGSTGSTR